MLIVIFWVIISLIFIRQPLFSLQEMNGTPLFILQTIPPAFWPTVRIIGVAIMTFSMMALTKQYFPESRTKSLIFFATMPWVFIIAHEFDPMVLFFVLCLSIYLAFPKLKKYALIIILSFLLFFAFKYNSLTLPHLNEKLNLFKYFFNITDLFIRMEPISAYLRVPRNSYFSYIFLIPFIVSFCLLKKEDVISAKKYITPLLLSLAFFFIYPSNHMIFSGVGFLLLLSLYIIRAFNSITRNKLIAAGFIVIAVALLGYFIEAYIRQYPMKYSVERSEAKINLINYVIAHPDKKIYLSNDDNLRRLMTYYEKHTNFSHVFFIENEEEFMENITSCQEENIACIFDDMDIEKYKIDKNMPELEHITLKNALSIYYIY